MADLVPLTGLKAVLPELADDLPELADEAKVGRQRLWGADPRTTALTHPICPVDTSITVGESKYLPVGTVLLVGDEVMWVVAHQSDRQLLVSRAKAGTIPAHHHLGAQVAPLFTP